MAARLSFVTTVAGRLQHLQQTLPPNLAATSAYPEDVDFLLLNYDADPAFRDWTRLNAPEIGLGARTHYFELVEPRAPRWHASYAKNVIHLLAEKPFVCNLDADNLLSPAFVREVVSGFESDEDVFFTLAHLHMKGLWGRIALSRSRFVRVGGYDESYFGWGFEDVDLVERLARCGLRQVPVSSPDTAIEHDDDLRVANYPIRMAESRPRNARRLLHNRRRGVVATNGDGWGKATVEKDFCRIVTTSSSS